jgi:hypothetical protein
MSHTSKFPLVTVSVSYCYVIVVTASATQHEAEVCLTVLSVQEGASGFMTWCLVMLTALSLTRRHSSLQGDRQPNHRAGHGSCQAYPQHFTTKSTLYTLIVPQVLQDILRAAADAQGAWYLPLPPDRVAAVRDAMERHATRLDEALLSNAFAYMRKAGPGAARPCLGDMATCSAWLPGSLKRHASYIAAGNHPIACPSVHAHGMFCAPRVI